MPKFDDNDQSDLRKATEVGEANGRSIPTTAQIRSLAYWLDKTDTFDPPKPLDTTYPALNNALHGGMIWGAMYTVLGLTGEGKSTLAANFGLRVAHTGIGVLLFTLEDDIQHVVRKLVSTEADAPYKMVSGQWRVEADEGSRIDTAKQSLREIPFRLEDDARELQQICQIMEKESAMQGVRVVIIDQSSCVEVPDEKDEYKTHREASKRIRDITKKLKIITIVLTQVNRSGSKKKNEGGSFDMDNIRSSSTWAHDSRGVIVVKDVGKAEKYCPMTMFVNKHNFGFERDEFLLAFDKKHQRIIDWEDKFIETDPSKAETADDFAISTLVKKNFFTAIPAAKAALITKGMDWKPKISKQRLEGMLASIPSTGLEAKTGLDGVFALRIGGSEKSPMFYSTSLESLNLKNNESLRN